MSLSQIKIIVNLDSITRPLTGIGQFSLNLGDELQNHNNVEFLYCYISSKLIPCPERLDLFSFIPNPDKKFNNFYNFLKSQLRKYSLIRRVYTSYKYRNFWKQVQDKEDYVYLETGFILRPFPGPCVPINFDLSYLLYPEFHVPSLTEKLCYELPCS